MSKKILMVIAPENYRDPEYFVPREVFEKNGAQVTVASISAQNCIGAEGGSVKPDLTIDKISIESYDALTIVGGTGCIEHLWGNSNLRRIIQSAHTQNKLVTAICAAPITLARAGILRNKKVTMFPMPEGIEELSKVGAHYLNEPVVVFENIITSDGPNSAKLFGEAIVNELKKALVTSN